MKKIIIFGTVLLTIVIAVNQFSCYRAPFFDPVISDNYNTLQDFTLVAKIGPITTTTTSCCSNFTYRFVPDQISVNPLTGFLLKIQDSGDAYLYYIKEDGTAVQYIDNTDPQEPRETIDFNWDYNSQINVFSPEKGYLYMIFSRCCTNSYYAGYRYSTPLSTDIITRFQNEISLLSLIENDFIRSVNDRPAYFTDIQAFTTDNISVQITGSFLSPVEEKLYICFNSDYAGEKRFYEVNYDLLITGLSNPAVTRNTYRELINGSDYYNVNYFYNLAAAESFLAIPDHSNDPIKYDMISWINTTTDDTVVFSGLTRSIIAMLSSGNFLSYALSNSLNIHSPASGTVVNTIDNNNLQFEGEYTAGSVSYSLFSYIIASDFCCPEKSEIYIYLYSYPTNDLNTLGK